MLSDKCLQARPVPSSGLSYVQDACQEPPDLEPVPQLVGTGLWGPSLPPGQTSYCWNTKDSGTPKPPLSPHPLAGGLETPVEFVEGSWALSLMDCGKRARGPFPNDGNEDGKWENLK